MVAHGPLSTTERVWVNNEGQPIWSWLRYSLALCESRGISVLTQKNRVVSLICRTNYCWMLIWRLRSAKERDQILEELDALMDRKVLLQLYLKATEQKHSFWYINLLNEQDAMFYKNFEHRMVLIDKDGSQSQTSTSARIHGGSDASGTQSLRQR